MNCWSDYRNIYVIFSIFWIWKKFIVRVPIQKRSILMIVHPLPSFPSSLKFCRTMTKHSKPSLFPWIYHSSFHYANSSLSAAYCTKELKLKYAKNNYIFINIGLETRQLDYELFFTEWISDYAYKLIFFVCTTVLLQK